MSEEALFHHWSVITMPVRRRPAAAAPRRRPAAARSRSPRRDDDAYWEGWAARRPGETVLEQELRLLDFFLFILDGRAQELREDLAAVLEEAARER